MKTIIVHHRSPHHAENSGYGRLVDYMDGSINLTGQSHIPYRMAKFIGSLSKQNAGIYNSSSVHKELQLYSELKHAKTPTLVHYLNAERDVRYLAKYYKRNHINLVGTFHKPPEVLRKTITDTGYLKRLDAAICVGSNQVEFIKNWLDLERVVYIPHGIDTHFFKPDISKKSQTPQILFVGQHLRDFEIFNNCISKILEQLPNAHAVVALNQQFAEKINKHQRVKLYTEVNDIGLRNLYQSSHLLFLPLKDVTACNSILEALACGLPIITSQVGGMQTYLESTGNMLCENDKPDSFIESCVALLKDKEKQTCLGVASRDKALEMNWKKVAEQIAYFYKTVIK